MVEEVYTPDTGDENPKRCDKCEWLRKEPAQWGFDPYCHGYGNHVQGFRMSLEIWLWIKRYGCGTFSKRKNKTLE